MDKQGRSSENKTEAAVALQLGSADHPQFLKMQVIPDATERTLLSFAQNNVIVDSTIRSDAFKSYNVPPKDYDCDMQKYNSKSSNRRLKWLHVMISNI